MGWISERSQKRGGGLNNNPSNNGSDIGPLRKVVEGWCEIVEGKTIPVGHVLECGHKVYYATDMFGIRYPKRRRCKECKTKGNQ